MNLHLVLGVLLLAPFLGFLINGFRFRSENAYLAGTISSVAAGISFVCSVILFQHLLGLEASQRAVHIYFFDWITVENFSAKFSFLIDPISAIMILVVTGVGTLIHIFSVGYMSHDKRPAKYFAYLNFFLFNMLLLVLGDNLLIMFVGWEGVGLCSYLLIGFWFTDSEKAAAGMKAFITNRIGDAGFLLGIFVLFITFNSIEFTEILSRLPLTPEAGLASAIPLACLFLFIGATGKSAQIPLYVWLPDAMAGPTPVSALIHAATMVTAGVYMIVRLSGLFVLAPDVMMIIATIGALTAIIAATIGLTQWDIKKVLAYSTVSQLGYMFLGVGVGAFVPALFHLMTHAFFKALMFLGSGSVIHAMHEEQDIRKMGGLKKYMPITHLTFTLGWLAIIGMPPFAGFFSKDEILWNAFNSSYGNKGLWFVGLLGAACTAFYMTRLMALVFWGKSRVPKETHPHESPFIMTFPLIVLGVLSVIGGWIGIPHVIGEILPGHPQNAFMNWVQPYVASVPAGHGSTVIEWSLMGISVGIAGLAAWFAFDCYIRHPEKPQAIVNKIKGAYDLAYNKYYVDEAYFAGVINPLVDLSKGLWTYVDVNFIDKTTYLIADYVKSVGSAFKTVQNGNMQQYALYIAVGTVAVLTFVLMG